jgi:hypothetical protein
LYNLLHGKNPDSGALLAIVGLTEASVVRFRYAWVTAEGQVAVYTRNGGGNRKCWCEDDEISAAKDKELTESGRKATMSSSELAWEHLRVMVGGTLDPKPGQVHDAHCTWAANKRMAESPLYIRDEDDGFDATYATFYFKVPAGFQKRVDALRKEQADGIDRPLKEKFDEVMAAVRSMTPEQLEREFPEVTAVVKKLGEFVKDGS